MKGLSGLYNRFVIQKFYLFLPKYVEWLLNQKLLIAQSNTAKHPYQTDKLSKLNQETANSMSTFLNQYSL